jgi:hypothetical protein
LYLLYASELFRYANQTSKQATTVVGVLLMASSCSLSIKSISSLIGVLLKTSSCSVSIKSISSVVGVLLMASSCSLSIKSISSVACSMENDEGNAKMEVLDATKKLNLIEENEPVQSMAVEREQEEVIKKTPTTDALSIKSISSVVGVLLMTSSCSVSIKSISSVVGVSLMTSSCSLSIKSISLYVV